VLSLLAAGLVLPAATGSTTAAAADGTTRYVDIRNAACSDSDPGAGAQDLPYCTVQAATDAAGPGDTVSIVQSGSYPATTVTASGAPGRPLTITGDVRAAFASLTFSGVHDVTVNHLYPAVAAGGIQVRDSSGVTLDFLGVSAAGGSAAVDVSGASSDVRVSRSYLTADGTAAVRVGAGVQRAVITTDEFDGNGSGVTLDGAVDTAVTGNTFLPQTHALTVQSGSTGTTAENNLLLDTDVVVSADSIAGTTVGYNLFDLLPDGDLYQWAETAYDDPAAFRAATGQGRMDVVGGRSGTPQRNPVPAEGSPAIDAADATAPGELATDIGGRPRVDDPLVADTGTADPDTAGTAHADRGARELQDAYAPWTPAGAPQSTAVGHPVTITSRDTNPWHDVITRTYDFGDGTPVVTSTADSVQHTYTKQPAAPYSGYSATVTEAGHTYPVGFTVLPMAPLVAKAVTEQQDPQAPLKVIVDNRSSTPFDVTTCHLTFGDGQQVSSCWDTTHTYAKAGTYTIGLSVTDAGGRTATTTTKAVVGPVFVPMNPTRILDTHRGLGVAKALIGPGRTVRMKVNGAGGIGTATSVLLNLTVSHPTAGGSITVYPAGSTRPSVSNLSFHKGAATANLVNVPVGPDGSVYVYNSAGSVDLAVDAEGWNTTNPYQQVGTVLTSDARMWGEFREVLDTTGGQGLPRYGKLGQGKSLTFDALLPDLHNENDIEYLATAVVLDVTATHASAASFVSAYKPGGKVPYASELSFGAGEARSATIVVPVDKQGRVTLYNNFGSVDLTATVEGFYLPFATTEPRNAPVTATRPVRVLDTRLGVNARKGPIPATGRLNFKAAGLGGIPATATGVLLNLTALVPSSTGFLVAWGDADPYQPATQALVFPRGQITSQLVYLPLNHGQVGLYNPYGSVNVVADVEGYSTG
jgi:PKD repeat protein